MADYAFPPSPMCAVLTPFDARGEIDFGAYRESLHFHQENGVHAIIVCGTTAEFPSLTFAEKVKLFEFARANYAGFIIANVSSTAVREARELAAVAREHANAVLILPPYYFAEPGDEGVFRFVTEVMEGLDMPAYLYNFPRHSKIAFGDELVRRLKEALGSRFAGIKDSAGDFERTRQYAALNLPQFKVFAGNDGKAQTATREGIGVVTGAGNPTPDLLSAVVREQAAGNDARAAEFQKLLDAWCTLRRSLPNGEIPTAKAGMTVRIKGYPTSVRAPFVALDPAQVAAMASGLSEILAAAKSIS